MVSIKKFARRFAQHFLLWTVVALLFAMQWYSYDATYGHPHPVSAYVGWNMEQWYAWLFVAPLVLKLAAKRPIDPRRPQRALALHLLASVLFALLALFVQSVIAYLHELISPTPRNIFKALHDNFSFLLRKDVAMGVITNWALTGLAQTLHFYKENSNRQVRESQLERQLAQAQLQVLQMQLHPHFLFNTLHAIGTLIHEDPESAEKMLLDLSSLLRVFLEHESSQQISLRRELHLVDLYLSIQKIRFRDRLTVHTRIDPATLDCSIPSLILQPLVENAIVHGIAKNPGDDTIEIKTSRHSGRLVVEISNSNSSLPSEMRLDHSGWGVGLSNTSQRLTQVYNGSSSLSLQALSPRGVVCSIAIPFEKSASISSSEEELLAL
jgi:two-component system, LytTR family, sensor kinase